MENYILTIKIVYVHKTRHCNDSYNLFKAMGPTNSY